MSQNSRKSIKDKIARQIQDMKTPVPIDNDGRTGRQQLQSILAPDVMSIPTKEELEVKTKPKIVLYLREGLKGAERNWTKYPNEIHSTIRDHLSKPSDGIIYFYMWRTSWGFGRNYCRISQRDIVDETIVDSVRTVKRALDTLAKECLIVRAMTENEELDITRQGTLYRIMTPAEIEEQVTEEGIAFEDIPEEGVVMVKTSTDKIAGAKMSGEIMSPVKMSWGLMKKCPLTKLRVSL